MGLLVSRDELALADKTHGSELDATATDVRRGNFIDLFLRDTKVDEYITQNMYGMKSNVD